MKKLLLLAVLSGAAVFSGTAVMSGCGGGDGTGGGGGGSGGGSGGKTLCSSDADCSTGHICDPGAKVCVQSCSVGSDCTEDTNSSCGTTIVSGGSSSVCHCATDSTCNTAFPGTICATVDQVCTKKCTTSSECASGRTCDSSGDCIKEIVDSGTPCTMAGTCGAGEICDYAMSKCVASPTCSHNNAEPDTCPYNDVCNSGDSCDELLAPTCGNFTSDTLYSAWDPATANGPVIYNITDDATDDIAFCMSGFYAHSIDIYAYWTQAWPNMLPAAPSFKYVSSTGGETTGSTIGRPQSGITAMSGNNVKIKVTLCAQTSGSLTAGFYFTGGNGVCFQTGTGTPMP